MTRNLSQRVELAFPVETPTLKARVIREALSLYLEDNAQSWRLGPDGTYQRLIPGEDEPVCSAQMVLLNDLSQDRRE
jgi:polyphosphate kinase